MSVQKLSPNDGTVVGAFSKNCVLIKHVSASAPLKMYPSQSSSATTSIVVAMAASGAITLREGIPVIMGSNVGTSVTSTMVGTMSISTDKPAISTNIYLYILITTQYLPISTNIYQCPGVPDDPAQPGGVQAGLLCRHHTRPIQLVLRPPPPPGGDGLGCWRRSQVPS